MMMVSVAVAGELTERWRIDSAAWPALSEDRVYVVHEGHVQARSEDGTLVWSQPPPAGCAWLRLEADPGGIALQGQVFENDYLHLIGVADPATGTLWWTDRLDGRTEATELSAESGVFFRADWGNADRWVIDPRTGKALSRVFRGAVMHEYPADGGPHDIGYLPAVHGVGRIGPVSVISSWGDVSGWAGGEEPVWEASGYGMRVGDNVLQVGHTLVWMEPQTGRPLTEIPLEGDECTTVRLIPGERLLVRRCDGFAIHSAATGAVIAAVETTDLPVFTGESDGDIVSRVRPGEAVQWYDPATLIPGPRVPVPEGAEVAVLGDGLLLKLGPEAGFTRWTPRGSWEKASQYGNVEIHGGLIAWYTREALVLLDAETGAVRWQQPRAFIVGTLPGGTTVVRLTEGAVLGLR